MVSKVQKWGNSLAIRIPKAFAEEADIAEDSSVDISVEDGRIVVAAARRKWTLGHLVASITPANAHRELVWGEPTGRETW